MTDLRFRHTDLLDWTLGGARSHRIVVHEGGTGSSKTYSIAQAHIILSFQEEGKLYTCVRESLPALRRSALRDFRSVLAETGSGQFFDGNRSTLTYTNRLTGTAIEFASFDTEQKARGPRRDRLWPNEGNELSEEVLRQLMMRTRLGVVIDYNPSMQRHHIYDKILTRDDCLHLKSTYRNNSFLSGEEIREIEEDVPVYQEADGTRVKDWKLDYTGDGVVDHRLTLTGRIEAIRTGGPGPDLGGTPWRTARIARRRPSLTDRLAPGTIREPKGPEVRGPVPRNPRVPATKRPIAQNPALDCDLCGTATIIAGATTTTVSVTDKLARLPNACQETFSNYKIVFSANSEADTAMTGPPWIDAQTYDSGSGVATFRINIDTAQGVDMDFTWQAVPCSPDPVESGTVFFFGQDQATGTWGIWRFDPDAEDVASTVTLIREGSSVTGSFRSPTGLKWYTPASGAVGRLYFIDKLGNGNYGILSILKDGTDEQEHYDFSTTSMSFRSDLDIHNDVGDDGEEIIVLFDDDIYRGAFPISSLSDIGGSGGCSGIAWHTAHNEFYFGDGNNLRYYLRNGTQVDFDGDNATGAAFDHVRDRLYYRIAAGATQGSVNRIDPDLSNKIPIVSGGAEMGTTTGSDAQFILDYEPTSDKIFYGKVEDPGSGNRVRFYRISPDGTGEEMVLDSGDTAYDFSSITSLAVSQPTEAESAWSKRIKITVPSSSVGSGVTTYETFVDLSDLPASFFSACRFGGGDIRVRESDGTTDVPFEVVGFDRSGNTGELHFKGTVSDGTDTDFYIYYGNPFAGAPAASAANGRNNVWTQYEGVFHMEDDNWADSTGNGHDGTESGTVGQATGKVGGAGDFDGSTDYLSLGTGIAPVNADSFSIMHWVNLDVTGEQRSMAFSDASDGYANIRLHNGGTTNQVLVGFMHGISSGLTYDSGVDLVGNWNHIVYASAPSDEANLYFNGTDVASGATDASTNSITPTARILGAARNGTLATNGKIDEFRVAHTKFSDAYIATVYSNQNDPSNFYTVGSEETL